jgi:hypothetical protein
VKLAVAAVSDGSRMLGCRLRSGWRIRPVKLPTRPASKTGDLLFREELMVRIHLPPAVSPLRTCPHSGRGRISTGMPARSFTAELDELRGRGAICGSQSKAEPVAGAERGYCSEFRTSAFL